MESSYGVGVQNRFCLPDEDRVEVDDPQDILQDIEKKAAEVKKEVPTKKPVAKGQQSKGKSTEKNQKAGKSAPAGGDRSKPRGERQDDSRVGFQDRRSGPARQNFSSGDGFGSDSRAERGERGRGRGRGRGSGRGRGVGGGRREFDRRSGNDRSSVKPQEKREGGGSHNWGKADEDFNSEGRENTNTSWGGEEERPEEGSKENVPADGVPSETVEGEEAQEEEAKTMTLDEYKAQLEKERFKSDVRVRKAGENEDMSRWKNTSVLKKTSTGDDEDDEEYVYEKREQRAKHFVDLNVRFNEPARRGGPSGRGEGRGRGRGGRGRGEGRGASRAAPETGYSSHSTSSYGGRGRGGNTPNFSSEVDFPALG